MQRILCISLFLLPPLCGCGGQDLKAVADRHVQKDMFDRHEKREAIPFFERQGRFYDLDDTTHVDHDVVLPLLKHLKEIAATEQWAMLRPEKKNVAYVVLIGLSRDSHVVDQMAEAVEQADDQFSGFIIQQWGREWLAIDLIDQQAYDHLKKVRPDLDKQR